MISFDIRKAEIADVEKILELFNIIFDGCIEESDILDLKKEILYQDYKLIAYSEDNIIGLIETEYFTNTLNITTLAVHPDYQGKRIGTHLLHQALQEQIHEKSISEISLCYNDNNCYGYYRSLGFESPLNSEAQCENILITDPLRLLHALENSLQTHRQIPKEK